MAKISQDTARQIAREMCKPISDKGAKLQKELSVKVGSLYEPTIPKPVMDLLSTHPRYVDTTWECYISGEGIAVTSSISMDKPYPSENGNCARLHVGKRDAEWISKKLNAIRDCNDKNKEAILQIKGTLLSLGSYKRIREEFPEAAPFLPGDGASMQVALQIQPVRDLAIEILSMK